MVWYGMARYGMVGMVATIAAFASDGKDSPYTSGYAGFAIAISGYLLPRAHSIVNLWMIDFTVHMCSGSSRLHGRANACMFIHVCTPI